MKDKSAASSNRKHPGLPIENQSPTHQRILVMEGDSDLRQVSMELLMRSGYLVDTAANAATALQALKTFHYDLVITDEAFPKAEGDELPVKLRAVHLALPFYDDEWKLAEPASGPIIRLQPTAMLLMPYTVGEFVGTVRAVLRVRVGAAEQMTAAGEGRNRAVREGAHVGLPA